MLKSSVKIPFASEKHALIAKQTIEVDSELQPHAVKRTIEIEGNILVGYVDRFRCSIQRVNKHYPFTERFPPLLSV